MYSSVLQSNVGWAKREGFMPYIISASFRHNSSEAKAAEFHLGALQSHSYTTA